MNDQVTELAERGRSRSPEDRTRLVGLLLGSRQEPAMAESAWEAAIDRLLDEYERGEVKSIPAEEVFAKARRIAS